MLAIYSNRYYIAGIRNNPPLLRPSVFPRPAGGTMSPTSPTHNHFQR